MTETLTQRGTSDEARNSLPPHHGNCFGCGPGNRSGLGVEFLGDGDEVVGELVLDRRHEGAPGLAHGGAVSAALDEAAGAVLIPHGLPAVTAQLNITFSQPIPLGRPLLLRARLDRREGRKLHITARVELDGQLAATAEALFIVVAADHFHAYGARPGGIPALGI
ncbi:PaaI family thioesterase [Nocardia uniformis]|uniref:Acyl-coenzyme A thioesterase THEM4 n=1 Tax=Nocardia uniformis TaxID=53432 RepID=A0A849BVQ9_9NOCA|nr:PaaI family thioesterase [Nocardia uniformis]NNH70642.1 PaaI family thioesterase [Nocardia uniformis]